MAKKDLKIVKSEKCKCMPGAGLIAAILTAFGVYFLIWGFAIQISQGISWSVWNWKALADYFIAFVLIGIGKTLKHKAYYGCKIHHM